MRQHRSPSRPSGSWRWPRDSHSPARIGPSPEASPTASPGSDTSATSSQGSEQEYSFLGSGLPLHHSDILVGFGLERTLDRRALLIESQRIRYIIHLVVRKARVKQRRSLELIVTFNLGQPRAQFFVGRGKLVLLEKRATTQEMRHA